jgi:hypothetical protein
MATKVFGDMTRDEKLASIKGVKLSKLTQEQAAFCGLVKWYPSLKKWQQTASEPSGMIATFGIVDDRKPKDMRRNILGIEFG